MIASPVFGLGEDMGGSATPSSSDASDAVSSSSDAAASSHFESCASSFGPVYSVSTGCHTSLPDASPDATDHLSEAVYWRGMRDLVVTRHFLESGGSELAPMSTTADLDVAVRYCSMEEGGRSGAALLFPPFYLKFG